MGIKEELKQYRFKVIKVEEAIEEYEKYKTRAEKVTAVLNGMTARTNSISDKVGDNAIIMADIEREYQKRWQEAEIERLALVGRIKGVEEPYRTILFMRYIQNKNFEIIATSIGYSYKQILRLHRTGFEIDRGQKRCPLMSLYVLIDYVLILLGLRFAV